MPSLEDFTVLLIEITTQNGFDDGDHKPKVLMTGTTKQENESKGRARKVKEGAKRRSKRNKTESPTKRDRLTCTRRDYKR